MLGLVDLLRAVKGTAKVVLRRVPSKVGVGVVAVLWVGAVGAVFAYAHEDLPVGGSDAKEDASTAHRDDGDGGTSTSEGDKDGDGYDDATGTPSWTVIDPSSSSTSTSTGSGAVPGDDLGGPTGSSPDSPPSSDSPDPSWTPSSTTTPPTSGATTTTSAPPPTTTPQGGGILGGLIDLLGGGKS